MVRYRMDVTVFNKSPARQSIRQTRLDLFLLGTLLCFRFGLLSDHIDNSVAEFGLLPLHLFRLLRRELLRGLFALL